MKKIVIIHTSPVSLNDLKNLVKEYMPDVEMVNIIDDSLLEEVKKNGCITPGIISRMSAYIRIAETLHPDLIFNQCSSVGEAFDIAKKGTSVATLKIDEAMAEKAVLTGRTIGVIATVASTVQPSCNLIQEKAKKIHKEVRIIPYLVEGALDILMKEGNVPKHNQLVLNEIQKACEVCDVVVLAQGSMITLLPYLKNVTKPVLTSPKLAIQRAKDMLYSISK